jgi:hypothetical protein
MAPIINGLLNKIKYELIEFVPDSIWVYEYPVHFCGFNINARMTVIRLSDGTLMLHSPCEISQVLRGIISAIGTVQYIVAPGTFHFLHVTSAQTAFPEAETFICPGIESKEPQMKFDWILGDKSPLGWKDDLEQVLVRGSREMCEVAFFHKPSKTLLLVDLIENYGDNTENTGLGIKFWWKIVFHMWNKPKPAPEYQLGWKDKKAAKESLERMLEWDFERIVISHGDLIENDAKAVAKQAWLVPLSADT